MSKNTRIYSIGDVDYCRSYSVIIAKREGGKVYLSKGYWNCSATTGKHRNAFLGEGIAETRRKIEIGEYTLTNLNG